MAVVPAVLMVPVGERRPVREGTVRDSVDGGDSDADIDPDDLGNFEDLDPACVGGSRAGGCGCSCGDELGHQNDKVRKLEELVRLLVAGAGLAGWEETRRVANLRSKIRVEREKVERHHLRKMAAEKVAGEERKKLAKRE